jgi:hypothetical protein
MKTFVTANGWGTCCMVGHNGYQALASRGEERRALDLTFYMHTRSIEWCERTARRWKVANGFNKPYRRSASQRRFLKRIRSER